ERLYENLPLVPGKLRETLATGRKDAFLSRELATLNRDVPLAFDLETARRREPDWTKLRALWMELEFTRLLKDLPAPVAAVSGAPVTVLPDRAAVAAWLASLPTGAPLALDWAGNARPPDPRLAGIAVFHPAAGAARVPSPDAVALGDREVRVHDAKPLVEAWLAHGVALPPIQDSAVAAYLLNPARSAYRLEELWLEAFAKELERSLDNLTREIWQLAGEEFTIASPKQLAHILFEKLGLAALRRTKTGYSTDADVLTELALGHPLPAKILEHRTLA